ncbi:hypothetical protein EVG20_g4564 [Dentipellis fragilis]|uniref:Uncharacterized protein n=1 Tax=Dentipellis fragilis TaxID=205917 RepID=A0A4Y9YW57_9AGAM|nr:hypothetical protein EVG20_g4564 [Dentipellis fragilis]
MRWLLAGAVVVAALLLEWHIVNVHTPARAIATPSTLSPAVCTPAPLFRHIGGVTGINCLSDRTRHLRPIVSPPNAPLLHSSVSLDPPVIDTPKLGQRRAFFDVKTVLRGSDSSRVRVDTGGILPKLHTQDPQTKLYDCAYASAMNKQASKLPRIAVLRASFRDGGPSSMSISSKHDYKPYVPLRGSSIACPRAQMYSHIRKEKKGSSFAPQVSKPYRTPIPQDAWNEPWDAPTVQVDSIYLLMPRGNAGVPTPDSRLARRTTQRIKSARAIDIRHPGPPTAKRASPQANGGRRNLTSRKRMTLRPSTRALPIPLIFHTNRDASGSGALQAVICTRVHVSPDCQDSSTPTRLFESVYCHWDPPRRELAVFVRGLAMDPRLRSVQGSTTLSTLNLLTLVDCYLFLAAYRSSRVRSWRFTTHDGRPQPAAAERQKQSIKASKFQSARCKLQTPDSKGMRDLPHPSPSQLESQSSSTTKKNPDLPSETPSVLHLPHPPTRVSDTEQEHVYAYTASKPTDKSSLPPIFISVFTIFTFTSIFIFPPPLREHKVYPPSAAAELASPGLEAGRPTGPGTPPAASLALPSLSDGSGSDEENCPLSPHTAPLPPIQFWLPGFPTYPSPHAQPHAPTPPALFLALGARRACIPYTPAFQGLDLRLVRPISARERLAIKDAVSVLESLGARAFGAGEREGGNAGDERRAKGEMWSLSYVGF